MHSPCDIADGSNARNSKTFSCAGIEGGVKKTFDLSSFQLDDVGWCDKTRRRLIIMKQSGKQSGLLCDLEFPRKLKCEKRASQKHLGKIKHPGELQVCKDEIGGSLAQATLISVVDRSSGSRLRRPRSFDQEVLIPVKSSQHSSMLVASAIAEHALEGFKALNPSTLENKNRKERALSAHRSSPVKAFEGYGQDRGSETVTPMIAPKCWLKNSQTIEIARQSMRSGQKVVQGQPSRRSK